MSYWKTLLSSYLLPYVLHLEPWRRPGRKSGHPEALGAGAETRLQLQVLCSFSGTGGPRAAKTSSPRMPAVAGCIPCWGGRGRREIPGSEESLKASPSPGLEHTHSRVFAENAHSACTALLPIDRGLQTWISAQGFPTPPRLPVGAPFFLLLGRGEGIVFSTLSIIPKHTQRK